MNSPQSLPRSGTLLTGLILYALILGVTAIRSQPPAALPADAPAAEFSGTRAKQILQQLVGDNVPHPVGSPADAAVRERIVAELNRLGYQPRVETGFACDPWGTCAEVKNVVARLEGQEPSPAVMMVSHYDSVPAGPGASDDGAGVAAELEIARALKAAQPLRHPVIFLIDEGEEAGLLGAEAFVASDPWAKDVRAVVNVEARGTTGPSAMFETGSANLWLMKLYARAVPRPSTSSINYTVYKMLPNDTDFTVFKRPGVGFQGFNFAFIGDVAHYHTPLDNFANADPRSIQQQGENAMATLRALANSDLNPGPPSEAVFFDLFGWTTIWWPAGWTVWFAAIAFILLVFEISALLRRGEMRLKAFLLGVVSWPVILIAAGFLGGSFYFILRNRGALPLLWVAHSAPMLVACWALAFCVTALLALAFWRGAGFAGLWCGTWIWWALVSLILAILSAGVSYVFVLPVLAAALCGLWAVSGTGAETWKWGAAVIFPGIVAGAVTFTMVWFVYDAMGAIILPGITLFVALLLTPFVPVMGSSSARVRWSLSILAFAVFAFGGAIALAMPVSSVSWPERMNLEYYQDGDTGKAHWLATPNSGELPKSLAAAAAFSKNEETLQPLMSRAFVADASNLNLAQPTLTIEKSTPMQEKITYEVKLLSPRGAPEIAIGFPPGSGVESVSMNGHAIVQLGAQVLYYTHDWHVYVCDTVPADGVELQFTLPADKPVSVLLLDKSYGLPSEGAFLERARPNTTTASQDGDVTIASQHVALKPQ
jgi:hypothetical protein